MASHKIKIAARVRPRLEHEIDDEGIQVTHTSGAPSCISVPNPRDVSQIFNFPYVPAMLHLYLTLTMFVATDFRHAMTRIQRKKTFSSVMFDRLLMLSIVEWYVSLLLKATDNTLDLLSSDSDYIRIWCHILWQDPHNARNQSSTWSYPTSCGGLFLYLFTFPPCITVP